ncbi:MAG: hypothetical protein ACR2G2_13905 [Pseudonocardia sp.]
MLKEFKRLWRHVGDDDEVVLRAAGERAFCTRVDVKEGSCTTTSGASATPGRACPPRPTSSGSRWCARYPGWPPAGRSTGSTSRAS